MMYDHEQAPTANGFTCVYGCVGHFGVFDWKPAKDRSLSWAHGGRRAAPLSPGALLAVLTRAPAAHRVPAVHDALARHREIAQKDELVVVVLVGRRVPAAAPAAPATAPEGAADEGAAPRRGPPPERRPLRRRRQSGRARRRPDYAL